jgi:rifampicin phosphotransferase
MTIAWFNEVGATDVHLVGGKGANLGEMTAAGLPVPPGFCVTVAGYQQLIQEAGLWPQIEALLAAVPEGDVARLATAAAAIRGLIMAAPMPAEVAAAIAAAYAVLAGDSAGVAVRSSATAEDLPEASFAGQQESYLGVSGKTAVLEHVQRCWASLWTERAIAYRQRQHFAHHQVSLAVVVQQMVAADTAGVLFTVNPVGNRRDEMLLNAAYGLGESVVSGQVTPDSYRLARARQLTVREALCGAKETRIDVLPGGATQASRVQPADRQRLCLNESQLQQLLDLGLLIEAHYGAPQDIEWAFAGGQLYLLQTRPITSLPGANDTPRKRRLNRIQRRIMDDILEHYPDPPYPLDYTAVTDGYQQLQNALREAGFDLPPAQTIIRMDDQGISTVMPVTPRPTWRLLLNPLLVFRKLAVNPSAWQNGQAAHFASLTAAYRQMDIASLDNEALAAFIEEAVIVATEIGRIRFADYIAPLLIRAGLLRLFIRLAGEAKEVVEADLLGDLAYKTAEIGQALQQLAAVAAAVPDVRETLLASPLEQVEASLAATEAGRHYLEQVAIFLQRYGARTMKAYLPFSNRSWAEDPAALLATIAVLVRGDRNGKVGGRPVDGGERYHQLRRSVAARLPGPLRRLFEKNLDQYRTGHVAREATLYAIEEAFAVARQGVREAAGRLVTCQALPAVEYVLYLTLPELQEALRLHRPAPEVRRLVRSRRQARPRARAAWRDRGEPTAAREDGLLRGMPGSPGQATGSVRIVHGPGDFPKLQPGDVLVCPFTDPAWTPLFSLAAAVVADTGGPLSHAAIVAREYGIPAVLGTETATSELNDGDLASVDGNEGVVRRVLMNGGGSAL